MENRLVISMLTIAAYILAHNGGKILRLLDGYAQINAAQQAIIYKCCWYVAFPLLMLGLFHGFKQMAKEAGLAGRMGEGIRTGLAGTLPMLLGAGALVGFQLEFHWESILVGCLLAAVGEELLYRAMLFGQLFRQARWGFLWAGMVSAVVFGMGHLYQGSEPAALTGIFLVTFMGGLWFSWLYVEWGYNLWVPMSYHFFMNLSWSIFDVSDNALGSWAPNVFRAATIVLSIVLTVRHKRKTGEAWTVKGARWWSGPGAPSPIASVKAPVIVCLLAAPILLLGQNEQAFGGKVADEHGHDLAYVNIGVVGTSTGTVSGTDGSFLLYLPPSVREQDSVRFSAIGHASRTWSIADFRSRMEEQAIVQLPSSVSELPLVEVKPRFTKRKFIGMDKATAKRGVNFAISDKPNQNLGAEIGRKFNLPKGQVQLDSFCFFVSQNNFDTVRFRIKVYGLKSGRPDGLLLQDNILVELSPRQRGWVGVNLLPYNLLVEDDVAVSVEWIYYGGKGSFLSLPIAMPNGGVHFYKYGSQGNWKKFPGMSAAMGLLVEY